MLFHKLHEQNGYHFGDDRSDEQRSWPTSAKAVSIERPWNRFARRQFRAIGIAILLFCPVVALHAQQLDAYGGTTAVKCPAGPAPHFYTAKINDRWWLCTPAGNGFFMKGVYYVDYNDSTPDYQGVVLTNVVAQKYATGITTDSTLNWALQSVRRLQSWGFNTLNEYSNAYTWATTTDSQWTTPDHAIPQRMPFIVIVRPSWYAYTNANNWANAPIKDLVPGVTAAAYSGYRSHMPDVWDPNFSLWLQNCLKQDYNVHPAFTAAHNDYLVGFDIDESDNMQGFGAGPDFPTADISYSGTLQSGHTHPHTGWFILATAPTQSSNSSFGVTYSNTTVYTKQAFSSWLATRYGNSVASLNSAWGSKYTSFGSAGGFGKGTGVLDEDGTCPSRGGSSCWMGDPFTLAGETAGMQQDMSALLTLYVNQYYSVIKSVIDAQAPGYLLFGVSPIGGWGAPPRREVLQAASPYLDVFTFGDIPPFICSNCTDVQQRIDFAAKYGGDKPWVNWEGFTAQADSYWSQAATSSDYVTTQLQRGQLYQQMLDGLAGAKDSNGTYHVVGSEWWAFYDSRGEQANWGLLTRRDNAYDGVQAMIATGKDAWGYPTGGEEANYGPSVPAIAAANNSIYTIITGVPTATATSTALTSSPNPATAGAAVSLVATVSGCSGASGTVEFLDSGTEIGSAAISKGAAAYSTSSLSVGTHSITAAYGGNTSCGSSSSPAVSQVINNSTQPKGTTTTSLSSTPNPSQPGQAVTFTAKVVAASGTPAGTVAFLYGSTAFASATISGGIATYSMSSLPAGTYAVSAAYVGSGTLAASMSNSIQQVVVAPVAASESVTVTASSNPAPALQPLTLAAVVTGAKGAGTGLAQFFDNGVWIGQQTLSAGAASITVSTLIAGTHSIGVAYSGSSTYSPQASAPYALTITGSGCQASKDAATVSASSNPVAHGNPVTLAVKVAGGCGAATGIAQFFDGSQWLGQQALSNGSASFTLSGGFSAGTHSIGVAYSGDSQYSPVASPVYTLTVN